MASRKKKLRALAHLSDHTRRDYTKDDPLEFAGTVARLSTRPNSMRFAAPILRPFVDIVPSVKPTQSGRSAEKQIRVVVMVTGLIIAVWGGTMATALLGCVIAMVAQAIPVNQTTKLRWQRQLDAMTHDRQKTVIEPVLVRYDGRGVSVLEAGTTWRRVLTPKDDYSIRLRKLDGQVAFGVLPTTGGKFASLWFVCPPRADAPEAMSPDRLTPVERKKIDRTVSVTSEAIATLHDLLAE
jgi:hypothetical protein